MFGPLVPPVSRATDWTVISAPSPSISGDMPWKIPDFHIQVFATLQGGPAYFRTKKEPLCVWVQRKAQCQSVNFKPSSTKFWPS